MSTTTGDVYLRGPTLWHAVLLYGHFRPQGEILICTTELSDVEYSYANGVYTVNRDEPITNNRNDSSYGYTSSSISDGVLTVNNWTAMNSTSSIAFVSAIRQAGIVYSTLSPGSVASAWASVYDRGMLYAGDGMLVARDPVSVGHSLVTQVTRIPRAPLLTLVILDLLYALIGTCLAIAALRAVRKGPSVRDAQARLSNLAIVAESFESPAWGQDARNVDTLFAERRGEPTRRIALVKQGDGKGRKYKQLVVPKDYVKRAPTTEEFLARKTPLGRGESQV
ncbi:MAG: hypothetical protein Q9212_005430 [Teloschistes hypoglaucus]